MCIRDSMYGAPVDYKIAIKWFEKAYALEIYENVEILCDFYEGLYLSLIHISSNRGEFFDLNSGTTFFINLTVSMIFTVRDNFSNSA